MGLVSSWLFESHSEFENFFIRNFSLEEVSIFLNFLFPFFFFKFLLEPFLEFGLTSLLEAFIIRKVNKVLSL